MIYKCVECGADVVASDDCEKGDIFTCPDCGLDYVIEEDDNGVKQFKELNLEEEDWGE